MSLSPPRCIIGSALDTMVTIGVADRQVKSARAPVPDDLPTAWTLRSATAPARRSARPTTSFTLDNDDELTATTSSTGGFVDSLSYNANGEQTGRTLSWHRVHPGLRLRRPADEHSTGGSTQSISLTTPPDGASPAPTAARPPSSTTGAARSWSKSRAVPRPPSIPTVTPSSARTARSRFSMAGQRAYRHQRQPDADLGD